jgi:carboxyl-terminal processing protease
MLKPALRHPLTLACAGAFFCAGLLFPNVPWAHSGLPETVLAPGHGEDAGDLDPWNIYGRVTRELDDRYLGELPGQMRLTYGAIRGMLRVLDDPFTRFMDPKDYSDQKDESDGEYVGIGAYLDTTVSQDGYIAIKSTIASGPAAKAGLREGDEILKVNGRSVKGMDTEAVSGAIRGAPRTIVRLIIRRKGQPKPLEVRVVRDRVEYEVVEHEMKDGQLGYIGLSLFNAHADTQVAQAVRKLEKQGMKGLILDLRDNPGGVLEAAIDLASRFVPPGNNAVVIEEAGGKREEVPCDPKKYLKLRVPLVVLVDGASASAAEILAGAIKDNHTGTLVGEVTFGKGLVQSVIELPGGSAVAITSARYLTSKGNDINRTRTRRGGVEPDLPVTISPRDLFAGKDTQLDRAMEFLREQLAARPPG